MASKDLQKDKNGKWQDFVDHCIDFYEDIGKSEYRDEKIAIIKEAYRVYEQKPVDTNFPWPDASNVILPLTTITVDNLEPRLVSGLTGKKPIMSFQIEGLTEQDEPTKILEDWFNDELDQVVKINDEVSTIVHKSLLEGTVFPIATYTEDEIVRRDYIFAEVTDPQTGQMVSTGNIEIDPETGEALTEDITDSVFQGGKVEYAEFTDVYMADDADDWESADVIRKIRPTYGELQQVKDDLGWMNIGDWLLDESKTKELSGDDQSPAQFISNIEKTGKETIPCLECYIDYTFKKEDQEDEDVTDWSVEKYVAVIAEQSKIIIRMLPLRELNFKNEKPIKRIRLYKEHGRSCGTSMYEKMMAIQDGTDDIFNMVVNVANVTMIPWFMYGNTAGIDGEPTLIPGKGIPVDDPTQIIFPKFSQNPRSYIVFIEMFMSLWEKLGAIGDIQIGRLSESRKDATATETMAAIQEGNIKHNYQSITFKEDFLSLLRTLYDLYYQKMPYDKKHLYKGQQVQIPRKQMRRPYKFKLSGSTDLANKVLEMQKVQQLYQALSQNPVADPIKITTDLVESVKPDAIAQQYINPQFIQMMQMLQQNPELPQVMQQYLQQKQTQAATQQNEQEFKKAQTMGKAAGDQMVAAVTGQPQGGQAR